MCSMYVSEGIFGKKLVISIQNDGPVTVHLESPFCIQKAEQVKKEKADSQKKQQEQQNDQKMLCEEKES